MKKSNALYKNQGIHVITAIFTVEQGVTKVLLVKRKNEPYKGDWTLTGGALYNNEDLEAGAKREILEKSGIENIEISYFWKSRSFFRYAYDSSCLCWCY